MTQQTYNTAQVAQILGVGRDQPRVLVKNGVLPNVGNSRRIRIPIAAVEKLLKGETK
jgi:excisionase family DNA binding protein